MEKKFIELKNGEKYAYIEQGKGDKNLILVHGNVSSLVYYKPLLERLPEDIHTYAIDMRGFGDSSYHKPVMSLEDLADDIQLFMEEMNIGKAAVVGWSLGGGVALKFAAKYPDKIEQLILLNSASYKGYPVFKKDENNQMKFGEVYESREEMAKDPVQVLPLLMAYQTKNKALLKQIYNMTIYTVNKPNEEDFDLYIDETLKQRNLVDVDFALASFNMGHEHNFYTQGDGSIDDVKAETLHVWGSHDVTVPEQMMKANIDAIKNSTYVKFDQCGHSPLIDKPDELTKVIVEFIK
jgi:pimeloyl-ACP methyl ester carboxylesterase